MDDHSEFITGKKIRSLFDVPLRRFIVGIHKIKYASLQLPWAIEGIVYKTYRLLLAAILLLSTRNKSVIVFFEK
jgi:uncharacterized membrane protein